MPRYLAYVDGTSFSDRLYWLLLTDSLVLRAGSSIRVWLDAGLEAWKHYVPVHGNFSEARVQAFGVEADGSQAITIPEHP